MTWTGGDFALVRLWRMQGLAFSEIGRRLGRTRNAVIGKWFRHGDKLITGAELDAGIRARTAKILAAAERASPRRPRELLEAA